MGVAESKLLAQNLLGACQKAENEGKVRLDGRVFWNDETITKTVKSICRHIPQDIRGSPRKSEIKKAIERSHTKLQVPKVVQDLQDKREILFPARPTTHDKGSIPSFLNIEQHSILPELPLDHLARCYITIVRYEDRIELDNIRLRLLYVAFYRLKKSLKDYPGAVSSIADALLSTGLIKDPIDIVRDRVTLWTRRGDRYDLLAKDLGGLGVLYILPDLGGESIWSRRLPKSATNESRISMIQKLKGMGIHAEAQNRNLHNAAEKELRKILTPLETSVDEMIGQRFSQIPRLNPTPNQPDPEINGHGRRHVSNSTSHNPCSLAGSPQSIQHSIDCGPLLDWREGGTRRTQNAETASDNAQNSFRQATTNTSLANRAELIRAQTYRDAFAQNALTPYDTNSMPTWDTNAAIRSSAAGANQGPDTLNHLEATTDTAPSASRLENALSTGNLTGLRQQEDHNQPGFFTVSQAFQGAQYPTGYTDTTQALSTDCWGSSDQFFDTIHNIGTQTNTQVNQITTQDEGIQLAGDNIGIDGYYNVYHAVQPLSLPGFTDANLAIQGSWDA